MGRVVMVTGVSRYLGGRFTQLLQADPDVARVIGVDVVPPKQDLGDAEFVRADIRNPIIGKVIARAEVDTVVHMAVHRDPARRRRPGDDEGDQRHRHDAAARGVPEGAERAQARREVVDRRSTAPRRATRRCSPRTSSRSALARSGYAKDSVEVEGYVRGFARRRPDVDRDHAAVRQLRRARRCARPLTSYFSLPVVPTVLGFDPRLQFVHEHDGLEVLWRATARRPPAARSTSPATAS